MGKKGTKKRIAIVSIQPIKDIDNFGTDHLAFLLREMDRNEEVGYFEIIATKLTDDEKRLVETLLQCVDTDQVFDAIVISSTQSDPRHLAASEGGYLTGFVLAKAIIERLGEKCPPISVIVEQNVEKAFATQINQFRDICSMLNGRLNVILEKRAIAIGRNEILKVLLLQE